MAARHHDRAAQEAQAARRIVEAHVERRVGIEDDDRAIRERHRAPLADRRAQVRRPDRRAPRVRPSMRHRPRTATRPAPSRPRGGGPPAAAAAPPARPAGRSPGRQPAEPALHRFDMTPCRVVRRILGAPARARRRTLRRCGRPAGRPTIPPRDAPLAAAPPALPGRPSVRPPSRRSTACRPSRDSVSPSPATRRVRARSRPA